MQDVDIVMIFIVTVDIVMIVIVKNKIEDTEEDMEIEDMIEVMKKKMWKTYIIIPQMLRISRIISGTKRKMINSQN